MMSIPIAMFVLTCVGSLLLWLQRFRFAKQHDGAMLSRREQCVSPLGIVDIGATVLIWFMLQMVAIFLVRSLMGIELSQLQDPSSLSADQQLESTGMIMLSQLASTVVAIVWFHYRHGRIEWLGTRRGLRDDFFAGGVAVLMLLPMVMLIQIVVTQLVPYEHSTLDSLKENFNLKTAIWAWVAAVVIAPVTEEFFFRGVLQGWLQRVYRFNESRDKWLIGGEVELTPANAAIEVPASVKLIQEWSPIVLTSIIFAGVHLGQGPAPIPLFFLSIGLGYLFRQTGSLVPCVIVHLALNAVSMSILSLSLMYPELVPADAEPAPAFLFFAR